MLINIGLSVQYGTTNFHKILYTEFNILIGYKFSNLSLQIRIIVKIRAVNYLCGIRVLFQGWKIFSELMLLYCPRIKCCDKLMALLLFYSVIKFLLITLTKRSSKGHAVFREAGLPARKRAGESEREGAHQYMADIKKVFIMCRAREY